MLAAANAVDAVAGPDDVFVAVVGLPEPRTGLPSQVGPLDLPAAHTLRALEAVPEDDRREDLEDNAVVAVADDVAVAGGAGGADGEPLEEPTAVPDHPWPALRVW
eukprot:2426563-Alexandrium_andersonii.AAC.1